jgi:hypothetical protein
VIAVRLDKASNQAAEQGYVEIQSTFVDPKDNPSNDPLPGSNGVTTAQQFFLSDTPCSSSGSTLRQEITSNHVLHNTLGTCASGPKTGSTPGAPDTLVLGSPPDPAPDDPSSPLRYDYSTDYPLQVSAAAAKGIQLRRDQTSGCYYKPTGISVPQWQVHRWVTDPLPTSLKMSERVTLVLATRTIGETAYNASLCVYLFDRSEVGSPPIAADVLLLAKGGTNGYWQWSPTGGQWPLEWYELQLPMLFNGPVTIPAGDRLGLAISLNGNSGADAISVLYDHPDFRARIEVETPTPIDGG